MPILAQLTQYLHNLEYNTASFSNLQYFFTLHRLYDTPFSLSDQSSFCSHCKTNVPITQSVFKVLSIEIFA